MRVRAAGRLPLVLVVVLATLTGIVSPAAADAPSPADLVAVFDDASLPGLAPIGAPPSITGDAALDDRIRALGLARGYERRAVPSRPLESVDGFLLQPEAAAAWRDLVAGARDAGHTLTLTSAYRSTASQATLFRSRLTGTSDAAIESALVTAAVPGYSKHHTGYAVDIRSGGVGGFAIRDTPGFAWLSADGFANARRFGWVPSYPDGVDNVGPDPEPWEFVWVGQERLACLEFTPTDELPFCDIDGSTFQADIAWLKTEGITTGCSEVRFCIDDAVTRGQAAAMIWRHAGEPVADTALPFADVRPSAYYADAIRWMVEEGITTGTSRTTFHPDRPLTRAEFVTLLWRTLGRPDADPSALAFTDVDLDGFAATAIAWAADAGVTTGTSPQTFAPDDGALRGQTAAFLHRYDGLAG